MSAHRIQYNWNHAFLFYQNSNVKDNNNRNHDRAEQNNFFVTLFCLFLCRNDIKMIYRCDRSEKIIDNSAVEHQIITNSNAPQNSKFDKIRSAFCMISVRFAFLQQDRQHGLTSAKQRKSLAKIVVCAVRRAIETRVNRYNGTSSIKCYEKIPSWYAAL